jgi:hypothetical protein
MSGTDKKKLLLKKISMLEEIKQKTEKELENGKGDIKNICKDIMYRGNRVQNMLSKGKETQKRI